jgi:hypothetical protein
MSTEVRAGLAIGFVNLIWLYLSYYLGLHTSGPVIFQIVPAVWLVITAAGFVIALRAIRRERGTIGYGAGLRSGLAIAAVTAVVAVVAQAGYFTVIHPEWPAVMVAQTREYFAAQGLPADEVEQRVGEARGYFTLPSYAAQSAGAALVAGAMVSLIAMIFLRRRGDVRPQASGLRH